MEDGSSQLKVKRCQKTKKRLSTMYIATKSSWKKLVVCTDNGREKFWWSFGKQHWCYGHTQSDIIEELDLENFANNLMPITRS